MKRAFRDPNALCETLRLPDEFRRSAANVAADFPLFAPRPFVARMRAGDIHDPLLRQVLPLPAEHEMVAGFTTDPVADLAAQATPGVIRKYDGRALLVTTGACAVHCRYCFRRHFPYAEAPRGAAEWHQTLRQLAADPSLEELIFSGGDPWTLRDDQWTTLLDSATKLQQLRRIRVHTRLPVVIPQRVTRELLDSLRSCQLPIVIVLHINHAAEIDGAVAHAIEQLRSTRAQLLNQAVLLRGVNDDVESLVELSHRLLDVGVMPYYLHQLDRVAGAAHFQVPEAQARTLWSQMQRRLPGYAVPRWVRDEPGGASKRWLS